MTISVAQVVAKAVGTAASSTTVSLTGCVAGNTLVVAVGTHSVASDQTLSTLVDSTHGNAAFTLDLRGADNLNGTDHLQASGWHLSNITGGSTTLTLTATGTTLYIVMVWEVAGIGSYDSAVGKTLFTTTPVTSYTLTGSGATTGAAEFIAALSDNFFNAWGATTTSTGWSTTDPNAPGGGGSDGYGSSHLITASAQTPSVLFSFGGTNTDAYIAIMVAYQAASSIRPHAQGILQAVKRASFF